MKSKNSLAELEKCGIYLPEGYKRRDKEEPGRTEKEVAEVKSFKLLKRLFTGQKKRIREWVELRYPERKQPPAFPEDVFDYLEVEASLTLQLLNAVLEGIAIEAGLMGVDIE